MATLHRVWQMLLKGIGEVEQAPDRRAAAEMVLIRLCHVADLPTPGDLVRQLSGAPPDAPRAAVGGGGPVALPAAMAAAQPAPDPTPSTVPRSFRDVVALAETQREAMLHAELLHHVHLVRYAPPVIELRPDARAPRDLAPRLARMLEQATGQRWTIAISTAPGGDTLAAQGRAAYAARKTEAEDHPLVRAILDAFPGAQIRAVSDAAADAFGLPAETPASEPLADPDMMEDDA